jgi:hypothetical protein
MALLLERAVGNDFRATDYTAFARNSTEGHKKSNAAMKSSINIQKWKLRTKIAGLCRLKIHHLYHSALRVFIFTGSFVNAITPKAKDISCAIKLFFQSSKLS